MHIYKWITHTHIYKFFIWSIHSQNVSVCVSNMFLCVDIDIPNILRIHIQYVWVAGNVICCMCECVINNTYMN
jgi:hypothetical protein